MASRRQVVPDFIPDDIEQQYMAEARLTVRGSGGPRADRRQDPDAGCLASAVDAAVLLAPPRATPAGALQRIEVAMSDPRCHRSVLAGAVLGLLGFLVLTGVWGWLAVSTGEPIWGWIAAAGGILTVLFAGVAVHIGSRPRPVRPPDRMHA